MIEAFRTTLESALVALGCLPSAPQRGLLEGHYRLLVDANRSINLTRITDPAQAAIKHYADSLALLAALRGRDDSIETILDVGTGGGFPAVPLAIMRPDWSITAIDGTGRKIQFLRQAIEKLELGNITAHHAHSRHWDTTRRFDLVTLRAVAPLAKSVEVAERFVDAGGLIAIYKTAELAGDELSLGIKIARTRGLREVEPYRYGLSWADEMLSRQIVFFRRHHDR